MDIFIKSFNRPYYLERCIRSIYKNVNGDFKIKILDDGTAPEYINKILLLFPNIQINYSPYYEQKWHDLKAHNKGEKEYKSFVIPSHFWFENISKSTDIFLLLEDDIWLTAPIDLNDVAQIMTEKKFCLLRLFWQGNKQLIKGEIKSVGLGFQELIPSLPWINEILLHNRFKLTSILYRLGIIKKEINFQLPFYTLYTVAGSFFNIDYWLYLWKDTAEKVNEPMQLKKAIQWFKHNEGKYAKTITETVQTSYISSATGYLNNIQFDMARFNYILNEAWFADKLDVMQNYPKDYSVEYLKLFLDNSNHPDCSFLEWEKWIHQFKSNYEALGCKTE